LLLIVVATELGLTSDPNPNPIDPRPARLFHLLAGGDHDRVGIGRLGLALPTKLLIVMAGLVPAIPMRRATLCPP
jgi:hypothetical protein